VYDGLKVLGEEKLKELKDETCADGAMGSNCLRRIRGRVGAGAQDLELQEASWHSLIQFRSDVC